MVSGKAISEDIQWIIIRLSAIMDLHEISMYTDIGLHSVQKILSWFKRTGEVNVAKRLQPQLHRVLCDYDIQVCCILHIILISEHL